MVRSNETRKAVLERKIYFGTLYCSIRGKNVERWRGYFMEENDFLRLNNISNKLFPRVGRSYVNMGFFLWLVLIPYQEKNIFNFITWERHFYVYLMTRLQIYTFQTGVYPSD